MTDVQQRAAAKDFTEYWKDKGYEKGQSQPFWLALLRDVFGVENPERFMHFNYNNYERMRSQLEE